MAENITEEIIGRGRERLRGKGRRIKEGEEKRE